MAARSAGKTMSPLGLFYRRIKSRIGGLGAVKATAHKLACLVYRMLKYGEEYVVKSMEEYEVQLFQRQVWCLRSAFRLFSSVRCQTGSDAREIGQSIEAVALVRLVYGYAQR